MSRQTGKNINVLSLTCRFRIGYFETEAKKFLLSDADSKISVADAGDRG